MAGPGETLENLMHAAGLETNRCPWRANSYRGRSVLFQATNRRDTTLEMALLGPRPWRRVAELFFDVSLQLLHGLDPPG